MCFGPAHSHHHTPPPLNTPSRPPKNNTQKTTTKKGTDAKKWKVAKIWIAGRIYDGAQAVLADWSQPKGFLRSLPPLKFGTPTEQLYSGYRKRPGPQRGASQPIGPLPYEPYGRRFTVTQGNRVDWMGWSLFAGYLPTSGPRFFDVRFKGERVAYEIGLSEAQVRRVFL